MDSLLNLATKGEVDRIKSARFVREALVTQGEEMVIILAPQFDPELFPESGPGTAEDVASRFAAQLQESTPRRLIDKSIEWLNRIEDTLLAKGRAFRTLKVSRLSANRNLRRTSEKVASAVIGVRDQVFSVYGEEVAIDLGFARVTPIGPADVLENALHLEERLGNVAELPEPAPGRLAIDFNAVLGALSPVLRELERTMAGYQTVLRQSQLAFSRKLRATETFDQQLGYLAGTTKNLFELAGMPREAELVRPSLRRRGVIQAVDGGVEPGGGEDTGGEGTAGEPLAATVTNGPQPRPRAVANRGIQETLSDDSIVVTAVSAEAPAEE